MSSHSTKKIRLDSLLVSKGLVESREKAKALILGGKVIVDGMRAGKAGEFIDPGSNVDILEPLRYVSRGGLKLEAALKHFHIDARGKTALDVGASTGGFTDCLLQHGAEKVYAVDVGYGQLDWKLRNNSKVVVIEKTNIRYLENERIPEMVDISTIDVSFISLLKVIPKVMKFLKTEGDIIALIKPQFEAPKKYVRKGGVVKEEAKRLEVVERVTEEIKKIPLNVKGVVESPLVGPKGNVEFFIHLTKPVDQKI
ncbi:TlyA family RNA methyltransferase [bacterium]|nr:MAG: TlyA family RNA methyltransferase [bacterium]